MPVYRGIQKEETLKSLVHEDYFSRFGYEPNIDNIDFVITEKKARDDLFSEGPGSSRHYLWAEAKKGTHDVFDMFTQLVLTCRKTYVKAEHLAPPWLGVFDEARLAFAAFHDMLPIFTETDFNWNTTPSNHETAEFQKAREEVKGSFFTPKIWADKSKEYLLKVFGADWQEEYYVWDCAAGTGNLLAGLTNKYNVWASDIEQGNVETMQSLIDIDENLDLLPAHVFQFDFLNDKFEKLPEELKKIIDDPEKRKKLIVYINPPYAEATSTATAAGTGHNKANVAAAHKTRDTYKASIGAATNEIYAQFMARIFHEIPECKLALFSKLKFVNSQNFIKFRSFFKAEFKRGFMVRADTFDNVSGKFPIGFTIWDLRGTNFPAGISLDVAENRGKKKFWALSGKSINRWIIQFNKNVIDGIAYMANPAPDFQRINQPYLTSEKGTRHFHYYVFSRNNIIEGCIYFAVRLCIEPTWLNDRDQFLYPQEGWKNDTAFQHDCLVFTLFHGQNRISSAGNVNHWIPFTEKEVGAKEKFDSAFMSNFLKERQLSPEAQAVLDAGREFWKYYHVHTKNNKTAPVNASFYDIREYFQGRSDTGAMKTRAEDKTYSAHIKTLREKLAALTKKIQPKVYDYGFLKE
jgi:hypothetical protein